MEGSIPRGSAKMRRTCRWRRGINWNWKWSQKKMRRSLKVKVTMIKMIREYLMSKIETKKKKTRTIRIFSIW
jgi:hypothetical protein